MKKTITLAVSLLGLAAQAAGFQIDDQGPRAQGMGGAVTALVDDASAVYYNPAGIQQGKGLDVAVGDTLIIPSFAYKGLDGQSVSAASDPQPPPHAYVTFGVLDQLTIGFGFYTPFGAAISWPKEWVGRYLGTQSSVQTFNLNPQIAYRVHPRFRLGIGLDIMRGTVQIGRDVNFVDTQGSVLLGGSAWGTGFNAGAQVEMVEGKLFFGATYRTPIDMKFDGRAHFDGVPPEFAGQVKDQKITASVTLPQVATFGFGWKPMDNLRFGLEADFVNWSSFPELKIVFEDPALTVPKPEGWTNQVSVHVGGEYDVNKMISVRLGFAYDPTPAVPDYLTPDLPDGNRLKFCLGVGWKSTFGLRADLGYTFVDVLDSASNWKGFQGTYSGSAQVIGIGLGYKM